MEEEGVKLMIKREALISDEAGQGAEVVCRDGRRSAGGRVLRPDFRPVLMARLLLSF